MPSNLFATILMILINVLALAQTFSIVVFNSLGVKVFDSDLLRQDLIKINTRHWQKGIYIISVRHPDGVSRRKVFKR